ncbi:non-ribosomal peptide synthetase [Micromonospora sp. WMMA1923]|uniref:non-ribosomal peptide synthetase n=1 Tax=Micromonospora sp. WMMA1923 TaxID=3404125 RepID=UPI003B92B239
MPDSESRDHPLAPNQQAMFFLHQLAPASTAFTIVVAARSDGPLQPEPLRQAVTGLVNHHPALRTTFPSVDGDVVQRVAPPAPVDVTWHRPAAGTDTDRLVTSLAERPFDLATGPVLRVDVIDDGAAGPLLLLVVHHLVADLWSMQIVAAELGERYAAALAGTAWPTPVRPVPGFPQLAADQHLRLAGARGTELREFWRAELHGAPTTLDLPTDRPRPPVRQFGGDTARFSLDPQLTAALRGLAERTGTTLYTVLLAAYQILLHRHTGQPEVLVGSPVHGRRAGGLRTVGFFVNTVVMRGRIVAGEPGTALLARLHATTRAALRHAELPLTEVVRGLRVPRDPSRAPLVQALFNLMRPVGPQATALAGFATGVPATALSMGPHRMTPVPVAQRHSQLDLTLTVAEVGDRLHGQLQYDTALFDRSTADRFTARLRTLLAALAAEPDRPVGTLPMLDAAERDTVLHAWNDTAMPFQPADDLGGQVARQARRTPDAPAVRGPDVRLGYAELDRAANRLAHRLVAAGAGPGRIVGLHLERGAALVVAALAVLRTGAAYLPLDPELPADRLAFMVADARPVVLLTDAETAVPAADLPTLRLPTPTADPADPGPPVVRIPPESSAYVIYTSGSTGRPKGVAVPHRALVNFLAAMRRLFDFGPGHRMLAVTTFSFDIAVLELFLPLVTGGSTEIVTRDVAADGHELRRRLTDGAVTHLQATPVTWQLLLDAGWRDGAAITALCGGEAMPAALAARLTGVAGRVWNMYGPTETTIWSAAARVDGGPGPVPIGRPVGNTQVYVLDAAMQPVPPGVVGEIYLGGAGVAHGYLHRPGLTAARFLPDPYGPTPGGRLYRTGDLGRYRPDGQLDYLGRTDLQVKLNGLRIELGEIEAAFEAQPGVRRAAVTVHRRDGRTPVLVGYLTATTAPTADDPTRQADGARLRSSVARTLPGYMVPSTLVWLDELPLTANGKVDRAALPAPEQAATGRVVEPPAGPVERDIAALVGELLGGVEVGRTDNLFELGGDSLTMSRLVIRLRDSFGVAVPLHQLFDDPTVARLAALVSTAADGAASAASGGPPPAAAGGSAPAPAVTRVDRSRYVAGRAGGALRLPESLRRPKHVD